jgi:hypothetical protein
MWGLVALLAKTAHLYVSIPHFPLSTFYFLLSTLYSVLCTLHLNNSKSYQTLVKELLKNKSSLLTKY